MTLPPGKLPPSVLARLLSKIEPRDPRVVLGPGIGRDAAVIDLGDRVLVAKTDPVTFATDRIGFYAVNVNANDVACMGARPAWFLACALLPVDADAALAERIFDDLKSACTALGVDLVGGHTEITPGIDRPIIAGAMIGEAAPDEIVLGRGVASGDVVLLSGAIAIEGTALLALESPEVLTERGVEEEIIGRAKKLLFDPGISVVRAAQTICGVARPRLMHDPTEGGLATALHEMSSGAGVQLRIDVAAVPVLPETRSICASLSIDPWGLLASGALLAIVAPQDAPAAMGACHGHEINCVIIGTVESGPAGVIIEPADRSASLRTFARDELARFYDELHGAQSDHQRRGGP